MLNLLTGMMADIIERIITKNIVNNSTNRSQEVLNACKLTFYLLIFLLLVTKIMCQRKHVDLDKSICKVFPQLFKFEKVGILFVDGVESDPDAPNLFKITHLPEPGNDEEISEYNKSKGFGAIVRFPKNIGLTGESIQKRKVVVLNKGERASNFASELDNMVNVQTLESVIIGPVFDQDGVCRGAVQFVNKNDGDENFISTEDIDEISNLLPTIAEIIRSADKIRNIYNTMTDINMHMSGARNNIENKLEEISTREFVEINMAI